MVRKSITPHKQKAPRRIQAAGAGVRRRLRRCQRLMAGGGGVRAAVYAGSPVSAAGWRSVRCGQASRASWGAFGSTSFNKATNAPTCSGQMLTPRWVGI